MAIDIIQTIANGFANNVVVPFIGAGASHPHLGYSWDSLCREMDIATGYTGDDNLVSAQTLVDKFGRDGLSTFLKKRISINEFRDELGEIYLFLLSMNCYFYYTTNQDNVFEKAFIKYGRKHSIISSIDTFKAAVPGRPTVVRFHGDLDYPDTIVFSNADFQSRLLSTQNVHSLNPLDIRLLSDSISRTLLFIGYSFRDPNIIELFRHIHALFGHNPPPSYLIEFSHDTSFSLSLLEQFNIISINPSEIFPGNSEENAYRMLIAEIAKRALEARNARDMLQMFEPPDPGIIPIVTPFEVESFDRYLMTTSDSSADRLSKFRATFDARNVPTDYIQSVKASITNIIQTAQRDDFPDLVGALFNLQHIDLLSSIDILSEYYIALGKHSATDPYESIRLINIHMHSVPSEFKLFAAAVAFEKLIKSEGSVSLNLLGHFSHASMSQELLKKLPPEMQQYVQATFSRAFSSSRGHSNPLSRPSLGLKVQTFEEIAAHLERLMPKKSDGPA